MNNEINNQKKNLENQNVQNDLNCKFGFFLFFLNKNSIALKKLKFLHVQCSVVSCLVDLFTLFTLYKLVI